MCWGYERIVAIFPNSPDPNQGSLRILFYQLTSGDSKMLLKLSAAVVSVFLAAPVAAEFAKINSESDFRKVVAGKTLTRPLIKIQVTPEGRISGRGASWDVTGNWRWKDGYFCRDLEWGGDDLGYNCQEVRVHNRKIRFTSDRGTGDFADFTLR